MAEPDRSWWQTVLHVVRSTLTLMRAEAQGLQGELRHGGSLVREMVVLGTIAFVFVFFSVGLLLAAALFGLSLVVPAWASALILAVVLVLIAVAIGFRMRRVAREMESPAGVVKRRVADHVDWWRNELVSQIEPPHRSDRHRAQSGPRYRPGQEPVPGERHE